MDIESVSQLVQVMESSTLSVLEVELGDLRIRLEKGKGEQSAASAAAPRPAPQTAHAAPIAVKPEETKASAQNEKPQEPCKDGWKEIKSPMVGAFHVAKAEGKPVGIGSTLKKGATVCILEAMKLMNDIAMPEDGEIVWAVAKEGEMVEYGQLLFQYK